MAVIARVKRTKARVILIWVTISQPRLVRNRFAQYHKIFSSVVEKFLKMILMASVYMTQQAVKLLSRPGKYPPLVLNGQVDWDPNPDVYG